MTEYRFNLSDSYEYLKVALSKCIEEDKVKTAVDTAVRLVVEEILYGHTVCCDFTANEYLSQYLEKIDTPSGNALTLIELVRDEFNSLIWHNKLSIYVEEAKYYVDVDDGLVSILVEKIDAASSSMDMLKEEIRQGIERGDWYPEHLRRLVE